MNKKSKKQLKKWNPNTGDTYYFITWDFDGGHVQINKAVCHHNSTDEMNIGCGNCFPTTMSAVDGMKDIYHTYCFCMTTPASSLGVHLEE